MTHVSAQIKSSAGSKWQPQADGSLLAVGDAPAKDVLTLTAVFVALAFAIGLAAGECVGGGLWMFTFRRSIGRVIGSRNVEEGRAH